MSATPINISRPPATGYRLKLVAACSCLWKGEVQQDKQRKPEKVMASAAARNITYHYGNRTGDAEAV